ncbi:MAG: ribosomal protein S18-alanine N-acetyltransferase [Dehalococcoidales bacterium]
MPYYVSLMHQQDIARVAEIDREAFPTMVLPADYQRELHSPLAHYVVAYDGERELAGGRLSGDKTAVPERDIVGFAGFWVMAGEAQIVNIAVRQSCRRRGIGELLLIALIDLAMEIDAHLLTLEVRASNTAAQSLYHKYGFALKGLRRGYYSDDKEDAVIMIAENIASAPFQRRLNQLKQVHSRRWGVTSISDCPSITLIV